MCWRQVPKVQKCLYVVLWYLTMYLLLSYALAPEATVSFVSNELRVGDKYVVMFLVAPQLPVFTDADGTQVFTSRHCKRCFITNNKGFLPMSEYDAIVVLGDRSLLSQTSAVMDPGKRYLIEAHRRCARNKFIGCVVEPRVTSFTTRETFDLCGLCSYLFETRSKS